ncbi:MAG: hypothetical protein KDA80_19175 [Planctomycetaceae bacterium]|nr:hypothetical protein [Planctomycetaceae bacterium]
MNSRNPGYINNVDELIDNTRPWEAAAYYGYPWPEGKFNGNVRLPCLFNDACNQSSYGALSVNVDRPHSPIYCHTCGIRGKLIELMWGMKHGQPFDGDKLRGHQFKEIMGDLRAIRSQTTPPSSPTPQPMAPVPSFAESPEPEEPLVNIPLKDQEKTRSLVNLWEDLVVDPAEMPPSPAKYFRQRPWLTPEVARKWKMGYLPKNGPPMAACSARETRSWRFKIGSRVQRAEEPVPDGLLRGLIVYAHLNEAGDILSYSGRDPDFEKKWERWIADGRPEKKRPNKYRFVKGFHKGIELYRQNHDRLKDRHLKENLGKHGLFVVEGQNDVMRLDCLGIPAVGLCSCKATQTQVETLERIAQTVCQGRLVLMPDLDEEGEAGFKELLWELAERRLQVAVAWTRAVLVEVVAREPESIHLDEWIRLWKRAD